MTKEPSICEHFKCFTNEANKKRVVCNNCVLDMEDNAPRLKAHIFGSLIVYARMSS